MNKKTASRLGSRFFTLEFDKIRIQLWHGYRLYNLCQF